MKIGTENIDEVLFDYFEGNLSEMEKKEVKQFIDENPAYLEDFRLWEVSNAKQYMAEPVTVDRSLLKKGTISSVNKWFLFIVGSVCVILIPVFMFSVNKEEQIKAVEKAVTPEIETSQTSSIVNKLNEETSNANKLLVKKKYVVSEGKEELLPEQKVEIVITEKAVADSLSVTDNSSNKEINTIENDSSTQLFKKPVEVTKEELTGRALRRETREIERRKQRAKDRKQQEEFLKGNKPYVVPINPQGL